MSTSVEETTCQQVFDELEKLHEEHMESFPSMEEKCESIIKEIEEIAKICNNNENPLADPNFLIKAEEKIYEYKRSVVDLYTSKQHKGDEILKVIKIHGLTLESLGYMLENVGTSLEDFFEESNCFFSRNKSYNELKDECASVFLMYGPGQPSGVWQSNSNDELEYVGGNILDEHRIDILRIYSHGVSGNNLIRKYSNQDIIISILSMYKIPPIGRGVDIPPYTPAQEMTFEWRKNNWYNTRNEDIKENKKKIYINALQVDRQDKINVMGISLAQKKLEQGQAIATTINVTNNNKLKPPRMASGLASGLASRLKKGVASFKYSRKKNPSLKYPSLEGPSLEGPSLKGVVQYVGGKKRKMGTKKTKRRKQKKRKTKRRNTRK